MLLMKTSRHGSTVSFSGSPKVTLAHGGIVGGVPPTRAGNGAGFDVLLAVVSCTAGIASVDGDHDDTDHRADDNTADKFRPEDRATTLRNHYGQKAGNLHFADCALGGNFDASLVIRFGSTVQDAENLPELA